MYLILGLGNPGKEYEHTFHNLGRMTGMKIQKEARLPEFSLDNKLQGIISQGKIKKERVVIALPETFMNKSGNAVGPLARYYKVKPDHILVIHDDADIRLGNIKIVKNRNSAGHKGVESVMRALKTEDFIRIRIGTTKSISQKGRWRERDLMESVIRKISPSQKPFLAKAIKHATQAALMIITEGIDKTMSMYN